MSTDYMLYCKRCKVATPIASDSAFRGWSWFCTPEMGPVWFIGHHHDHLDEVGIAREQADVLDDCLDIEPKDPDAEQ